MHFDGATLIARREYLVLSMLMKKLSFRRVESDLGKPVLTPSARLVREAALGPPSHPSGGFRPITTTLSMNKFWPAIYLSDPSACVERSLLHRPRHRSHRQNGPLADISYIFDRYQLRAHHLLRSGSNTRIGTLSTPNTESQDKNTSSAESHYHYLGRMHAWPWDGFPGSARRPKKRRATLRKPSLHSQNRLLRRFRKSM